MRRIHALLGALCLAAALSLVIALTALASPGVPSPATGPAAAGHAHALAQATATRVVIRRRVVRRCRRVAVRRQGHVVGRRKVCRRVVIRVRARVPVPPATTPTGTAAVAPPPPPVTTTGPGTVTAPGGTTTGGTTVPEATEVEVAAFDSFMLTTSTTAVPAGAVRLRFGNEGASNHGLSLRRPDGSVQPLVAPGGAATTGDVTVTLAAGTYTVFCPVPGHETRGMRFTLAVG